MPSSPSPLLGIEIQALGENLNTWGADRLNDALKRLEEAIAGSLALTVDADVTLTTTDYVANQARNAMLVLSGAGGFTVTCPATSKMYLIKNGCSAAVTFSHGSGDTVSVGAGGIKWIATDGTNFFTPEEVDYLALAGGTLTGDLTLSGAPTADLHAATKAYADTKLALAGGTMTGDLILNADATDGLGAVTLQQLNATALGAVSVSFAFSDITGKPTTIAGYGITDAYTTDQVYAKSEVYTQTEANNLFEGLIIRQVVSGDVDPAAANRWYLVDTGTAARSITLPASPSNGNEIIISDRDGNAATNNITVARNGKTVAGLAEDLTIDLDYARVRLRYDGTSDWELI